MIGQCANEMYLLPNALPKSRARLTLRSGSGGMATGNCAAQPAFVAAVATAGSLGGSSGCFCARVPQYRASWLGARVRDAPRLQGAVRAARRGVVTAYFGGGGILGVGPQELLVIAAVGWFLLGPKKLMALSKDIGKLVGEVRRAADDARATFTDALESDMAAMEAEEEAAGQAKTTTATVAGPEPFGGGDLDDGAETAVAHEELFVSAPAMDGRTTRADSENDAVRSNFLDQLQRVGDPEQVTPSEIPDLDMDAELEVARLEQQLLAARQKLQQKRAPVSESPAQAGGSATGSDGEKSQS